MTELTLLSSFDDDSGTRERFTDTTGHSIEEIDKLTIREDLPESERVSILLQSSNALQRLCGISSIPSLFLASPKPQNSQNPLNSPPTTPSTTNHLGDILTKFAACVTNPKVTREQQLVASETTLLLLENFTAASSTSSLSMQQISDTLLPLTMKSIRQVSETDLLEGWGKALLLIFKVLPSEYLKSPTLDLLSFLSHMSDPQNAAPIRILCCNASGMLSKYCPVLAGGLAELALNLAQDVDFAVRASTASSLELLAKSLGSSVAKKLIVPTLLELLSDESAAVRQKAFETSVNLLSILDPETIDHVLLPQLLKFTRDPPDDIVYCVASQFGTLLKAAQPLLASCDFSSVLAQFKIMATRKNVDVRRACAFSLPIVLLAIGPDRFLPDLRQTFLNLSSDSDSGVRRAIASCFHEVAKILSKQHAGQIKDSFLKLLKDIPEVVDPMLESIPNILKSLDASESPQFQTLFVSACLECHEKLLKSHDWRLHERFLYQLQSLQSYFPTYHIQEKLVPVLFNAMSGNYALPVKYAAVSTLCRVLYSGIHTYQRRKELCEKMRDEFGKGKSYWQRILFLGFADEMVKVFSRRFFKEIIWPCVLDLATDKVALVRMRACTMLPMLKSMTVLPNEASMLKRLNTTLMKLKNDDNSGVASLALETAERLNKIECPVEQFPTEEDLKDLNKELQEEEMFDRELADLEEARRKEEAERADVWRRMAEREAEIALKAKIYGKLPKSRLGRIRLPSETDTLGSRLSSTSTGTSSTTTTTNAANTTSNALFVPNQSSSAKPSKTPRSMRMPPLNSANPPSTTNPNITSATSSSLKGIGMNKGIGGRGKLPANRRLSSPSLGSSCSSCSSESETTSSLSTAAITTAQQRLLPNTTNQQITTTSNSASTGSPSQLRSRQLPTSAQRNRYRGGFR